jgi:protoporphyrinogen oxidase
MWDDTVWDYDPAEQAPWLVTDDAARDRVLWGEIKCGEANARLIAAAPDLLEALEGFLADFETWELADHPEGIPVMEPGFADIVDNARAAVKKARGKQS